MAASRAWAKSASAGVPSARSTRCWPVMLRWAIPASCRAASADQAPRSHASSTDSGGRSANARLGASVTSSASPWTPCPEVTTGSTGTPARSRQQRHHGLVLDPLPSAHGQPRCLAPAGQRRPQGAHVLGVPRVPAEDLDLEILPADAPRPQQLLTRGPGLAGAPPTRCPPRGRAAPRRPARRSAGRPASRAPGARTPRPRAPTAQPATTPEGWATCSADGGHRPEGRARPCRRHVNGRVTCGDAVTMTAVATASRTAAYTGGGSAVTSASTVSASSSRPGR